MMKKIISLVLVALMLLSPVSTMAAGGVELPIIPIITSFDISSSDAECSAGGTFDIAVSIEKNTGVKRVAFEIDCSEDITMKSAVQGTALSGLTMTYDKEEMSVAFEGASAVNGTGEAVVLTFELSSGASRSEYSLTIRAVDIEGANGYIPGAVSTSRVTVQEVLMGDVNNDGFVDLKDITSLRRYLAGGYGVTINEAASNVNGDDTIDLKDITYLRRALAGGYGVELQSVAPFVVVGTENCGVATGKRDTVALARADANSAHVSVSVSDIGLESYLGKTDDLMNFYLNVAMLGGKMTGAVVVSDLRDVTSIGYDSTKSFVSINGVRYTEDTVPSLCTPDGVKRRDVEVFRGGKLTSGFIKLIDKAFKGRIVDYDCDGKDDALMIAPKVAYRVNGFYAKDEVKHISLTSLDYSESVTVPVSALTAKLEKGDVFVGAKFNTTMYVEKANAVETYATGFGINGKVNLKNVGAVRYENVSVIGAREVNITEEDFGSDNIRLYYLYNNEILAVEGQKSAYSFAVLCDVEKSGSQYFANILVPEGNTLVKERLALHPSVAQSLYNNYKLTYSGNNPVYKYKVISGYIQTGEGCMPIIDDLPDDSFITVPAGASLTYDSENCSYTLGNVAGVFLDDSSSIFYKYTITSGESEGFVNLRVYTKDTITEDSFTKTTIDTSYLVKVNGCYVLVATMIDGRIG